MGELNEEKDSLKNRAGSDYVKKGCMWRRHIVNILKS